jgi:hypothetical protein
MGTFASREIPGLALIPPAASSFPRAEIVCSVVQSDWNSWTQRLRANAWTTYGTVLAFYFGCGLLLRVVLRSHQQDYLGFWGWFFLVSLAGAGYGFVRARQDTAAGVVPGRISRTKHLLAGALAVCTTLVIWFTDNTSARMEGRYLVAFLVAALMAVDSVTRYWRKAVSPSDRP